MPDSQPVAQFRTWLKQRIEAGEKVSHTVSSPDSAAQRTQTVASAKPERASARIDLTLFPADTPLGPSSGGRRTQSKPDPKQLEGDSPDPQSDSLEKIAAEVRACTACRLHETRTHAVPGVGPANAGLVFVGEGPGADEDAQGEPFVGRAGQLLTRIIESVDLKRPEVFITNIVKCRPPNNRDPRPDEVAACEPFLKRQLNVLGPSVICALGRHAAITLLKKQESMAKFRTGEHFYEGVRVFPTYHPAALLRNPQWKRPVWEDIQIIRREYDASRENR